MQSGRKDVLYKNSMDCVKKMYRIEGPTAFFKGVVPNVFKAVGGSLVLVMNDKLKKLF